MTTPIYGAVEWSAAQASPWVPHNAALRLYEAAIRGSVLDRDLTAPPGSCDDGASYLVAASATGLWAGHDGKLAVAVGADAASGWLFATIATEGQILWVEDEGVRIQYVSAAWATLALSATWGAIGGQIGDQTDLTAALAAAGGNTGDAQQLNGIVSGLGINYVSDLDFEMAAGSFYLDGALLTAAAQTISLDVADGSNPRIDVLYVDDTGTLGKITGSPAASPSQPSVDPTTQLYLTFVLVPAAATTLGDISNVDIYREGAEWTGTVSGAGFTLDSTNNPYAGTKCIEGTSVPAGDYVRLVAGGPLGFDGDGNLTLRIRSKANWNPKRWLTLQWFEGGVARGSQVSLKSGSFGFDSSQTASYQLVVISKALFQVPAGVSVDELRIADVGGSIGFYLDEIILQTTGDTTGGSGQASGISQADADARYVRRSLNLSDLTDAGDARTNIDVYSKAEVDGLVGGGSSTITEETGTTYSATAADFPKTKEFNNASAIALTIPVDLAVATNTVFEIHQTGAGAVTIAGASGVTVQSRGAALTTAGQFAIAGIKRVAENVYRVTGDVTA
ncbi:DUF2793 domain-containing protein [Croceicoccus gelatinilyticus]|uniref:DUF2793 domain-containing protein n=1 Tax=Croceicoccus gelatinilyticus TaxID=2835536 RepID=UPI001BCD4736|nr:DUF2793 domain-containing protein [Croceicoccus gelatinilyticus]MBS7669324.1 DUF2793 domain-containing protein [Croceicoccus gelatinilyticus]